MKNMDKEGEEWEKYEGIYQRISLVVNSINETMRATNNMTKISKIQRSMGLKVSSPLLTPSPSPSPSPSLYFYSFYYHENNYDDDDYYYYYLKTR